MCRIVNTTATLTNRRAQQLHCHYWKGQQRRCLVFLSHGFSEHLGLYHEVSTLYCTVLYCAVLYYKVGTLLAERGMVVFGHDHIGHGESEGRRAYIENVDHYVDDLVQHCMDMQVHNQTCERVMFDNQQCWETANMPLFSASICHSLCFS